MFFYYLVPVSQFASSAPVQKDQICECPTSSLYARRKWTDYKNAFLESAYLIRVVGHVIYVIRMEPYLFPKCTPIADVIRISSLIWFKLFLVYRPYA